MESRWESLRRVLKGVRGLSDSLPVDEGRQVQGLSMGAAARDSADQSSLFLCDEVPEHRIVVGVA